MSSSFLASVSYLSHEKLNEFRKAGYQTLLGPNSYVSYLRFVRSVGFYIPYDREALYEEISNINTSLYALLSLNLGKGSLPFAKQLWEITKNSQHGVVKIANFAGAYAKYISGLRCYFYQGVYHGPHREVSEYFGREEYYEEDLSTLIKGSARYAKIDFLDGLYRQAKKRGVTYEQFQGDKAFSSLIEFGKLPALELLFELYGPQPQEKYFVSFKQLANKKWIEFFLKFLQINPEEFGRYLGSTLSCLPTFSSDKEALEVLNYTIDILRVSPQEILMISLCGVSPAFLGHLLSLGNFSFEVLEVYLWKVLGKYPNREVIETLLGHSPEIVKSLSQRRGVNESNLEILSNFSCHTSTYLGKFILEHVLGYDLTEKRLVKILEGPSNKVWSALLVPGLIRTLTRHNSSLFDSFKVQKAIIKATLRLMSFENHAKRSSEIISLSLLTIWKTKPPNTQKLDLMIDSLLRSEISAQAILQDLFSAGFVSRESHIEEIVKNILVKIEIHWSSPYDGGASGWTDLLKKSIKKGILTKKTGIVVQISEFETKKDSERILLQLIDGEYEDPYSDSEESSSLGWESDSE